MTSIFDHLDPILNEAPLFCQVKEKTLGAVLNQHCLNNMFQIIYWKRGMMEE